jgi:hypothetical protein
MNIQNIKCYCYCFFFSFFSFSTFLIIHKHMIHIHTFVSHLISFSIYRHIHTLLQIVHFFVSQPFTDTYTLYYRSSIFLCLILHLQTHIITRFITDTHILTIYRHINFLCFHLLMIYHTHILIFCVPTSNHIITRNFILIYPNTHHQY